jgi:PAS domain-containing protein
MTRSQIDYLAVFWHLPVPVLLLTPDLVIADMNEAFLVATGRTREDLLGGHVFHAFPDNPADPGATGVRNMSASFGRVLATGEPDQLALQRYDVEVPGNPGMFARRYWCPVNVPVFGRGGRVALIANCVEEVTDRVRKFAGGLAADACLASLHS